MMVLPKRPINCTAPQFIKGLSALQKAYRKTILRSIIPLEYSTFMYAAQSLRFCTSVFVMHGLTQKMKTKSANTNRKMR